MKKTLLILVGTTFFFSVHAAWYDAPLRWFNQGMAWFRQSSYNAYQQALALAGYRAYQQPQQPLAPAPAAGIESDAKARAILVGLLYPDINAAVIAARLLTILEQQWEEEIQHKKPRYPELIRKQQMDRYSALKQGMLEKYPKLNNLSKYSVIIPIINDPTKNQNVLSYFPAIASTLNNFSPKLRAQKEPIYNNLIIWLARIKEYFDDPFASQYSLSTIIDQLKKFSVQFEIKMDPTLE